MACRKQRGPLFHRSDTRRRISLSPTHGDFIASISMDLYKKGTNRNLQPSISMIQNIRLCMPVAPAAK